ncbi:MAG: hypothetical protein H7A24_12450 [Leptospiraceae bacterium]|nr:hypothetical protein [Leptospiraceae bacterium]MCP5512686.1 hypothetical protein [Leptospiraceae bacterium]
MKYLLILLILLTSHCTSSNTEKVKGSTPNYGKPTAPLNLSWTAPKQLNKGENGLIEFEAVPDQDCENIIVRFEVLEGLVVMSKKNVFESGPKKSGEKFTGSIEVRLKDSDSGILSFLGDIVINGTSSSRAISVPINLELIENKGKPETSTPGYSDGKAKTEIKMN